MFFGGYACTTDEHQFTPGGGTAGSAGESAAGNGGSGAAAGSSVQPEGGAAGSDAAPGGAGGMESMAQGGADYGDDTTVGSLGGPCPINDKKGCGGHAVKEQLLCVDHVWTANGTCDASTNCDTAEGATTGQCVDIIDECVGKKADDAFCRALDRLTCGIDLVSEMFAETCTGGTCVNGACQGVCTPKATRCDPNGGGLQTCNALGGWDAPVACDNQACPAGKLACQGQCAPGSKQCDAGGLGLQTCDPDGAWGSAVACKDQACPAGKTACQGVCAPTALKCADDGLSLQKCTGAGAWGTAIPCEANNACPVGKASCQGSCKPGAKQCDSQGLGLQTCDDDGTWSAAQACIDQACPVGKVACQGVCSPTATRCSADGVSIETCSTLGAWVKGAACTNQACPVGEDSCQGVCTPGSKTCDAAGLGLQTCGADGQFGSAVACTKQACPVGKTACQGVCTPGSKQCAADGLSVQTCNSTGGWNAATSCTNQACPVGKTACQGVCTPGTKQCSGNGVQTCDANGAWPTPVACPSINPVCSGAGVCGKPQSCNGIAIDCGAGAGSSPFQTCCASPVVPGGTFNRSNNAAYPATVSSFRLDAFEVTVGRFKNFVAVYKQNMTPQGAGKNPNNASDTGWNTTWNAQLPADAAALKTTLQQSAAFNTWATNDDKLPINCVSWYAAAAFCAWDGGRLPTEAELNYAAAGGAEQRKFAWGATDPTPVSFNATYGCTFNDSGTCSGVKNIAEVGFMHNGGGKWGQFDLTGNLYEWAADWWADTMADTCTDCINFTVNANNWKVVRNGAFALQIPNLTTAYRDIGTANFGIDGDGFRCARAP
jgi:formylglycine-generating enzyme required for sulfatase activity